MLHLPSICKCDTRNSTISWKVGNYDTRFPRRELYCISEVAVVLKWKSVVSCWVSVTIWIFFFNVISVTSTHSYLGLGSARSKQRTVTHIESECWNVNRFMHMWICTKDMGTSEIMLYSMKDVFFFFFPLSRLPWRC